MKPESDTPERGRPRKGDASKGAEHRPEAEVVPLRERAQAHTKVPTDGHPCESAASSERRPTSLIREATFRRLAELVRERDPVPEAVVGAAQAAFSWRSVDDELARLVYDSERDVALLAAVRAGGAVARQLTFESPDLVLEVEVTDSPRRALTCQVVPPQPVGMELRHRDGVLDLGSDEFGTFHLEVLPEGPVSLRCLPVNEAVCSAATSWVTL